MAHQPITTGTAQWFNAEASRSARKQSRSRYQGECEKAGLGGRGAGRVSLSRPGPVDEVARGWRYRQPLPLEATVDAETLSRHRVPRQVEANVAPPAFMFSRDNVR